MQAGLPQIVCGTCSAEVLMAAVQAVVSLSFDDLSAICAALGERLPQFEPSGPLTDLGVQHVEALYSRLDALWREPDEPGPDAANDGAGA